MFPDLEELEIELKVMGKDAYSEDEKWTIDREVVADLFTKHCPQVKKVIFMEEGKVKPSEGTCS